MTINESLRLSARIHAALQTDLLHAFQADFPINELEALAKELMPGSRERVFTPVNTVLAMLFSATQEDKSLQKAQNIFADIYERRGREAFEAEEELLRQARLHDSQAKRKAGQPKKYRSRLPKSSTRRLSASTAAYSTARKKLDVRLAHAAYGYSTDFGGLDRESWHGMKTYICDGTFLQLQDEAGIKTQYSSSGQESDPPKALLQVMIRQGSGQICQFAAGSCRESELAIVVPMLRKLKKGGLLLADDLYNAYYHFHLTRSQGCHIIVPGKRKRNFAAKRKIGGDSDQIVEISKGSRPDYVSRQEWDDVPCALELRRIAYAYPTKNGLKEAVLYTTILDENIKPAEIVAKYCMRWDIEITIREIKEIMDIRVLRSKSRDMLLKELTVALTAYNMVRKIIAKSADPVGFPPQEGFFQECYPFGKPILLDKKGRIYSRWSPGRHGYANEANRQAYNT
jgi:hypothetical protein